MGTKLKRVLAGAAAVATAATVAPVILASPAFAAATNNGVATLSPTSGTISTPFNLSLGATTPSCPGDSASGGYRWQTFMIPASADIASTLTFGSTGPTAVAGEFRQPLFTTTGSPVVNKQTDIATTAGGPGTITGIPQFSYNVFGSGTVPAGAYKIGVACTLGAAGPTQLVSYWSKTVTIDAATSWQAGAAAAAPTLTTVTPGDGSLTATFTPGASDPADTGYTVSATPTGGGTAVTATGTSSPITVTGLTNGTQYDVVVSATNGVGSPTPSNMVQGTPALPALNAPAVTGAPAANAGDATVSWTVPANTNGVAPSSYDLTVSDGTTTVASFTGVTSPYTVPGLTAGTLYTATVTANYPGGYAAQTGTSAPFTVNSSALVYQDITVQRPAGSLVLTQVCSRWGALPAEASNAAPVTGEYQAGVGFEDGLPAASASGSATVQNPEAGPTAGTGTAPLLDNGSGQATTSPDGNVSLYPYPTDANGVPNPNVTHCGVDLGIAKFVTHGAGSGQFFAAQGRLSQVTAVDTRDTDQGWNITGQMSDFTKAGGTATFSGSQLGWEPVLTDKTPAFTDASGVTYTQMVHPGPYVLQNSQTGLGQPGHVLLNGEVRGGSGTNLTGGLGTAIADARLKLVIPVTAISGTYNGTLTLSLL